jgi:ribosome-binding protein aMBF1 (putative translation factor)
MQMVTLDELKSELMKNPSVKHEYEALEGEFKFVEALIDMRQKAGLSQEEVAQKMNSHINDVIRLQSGSGRSGWKALQRYAHACGFKIQLKYSQ